MSQPTETALITGASAGLGSDYARQLAPLCSVLILVARRLDRLESLKGEILQNHPALVIHCLQVDLQEKTEVERLVAWINAGNQTVTWLVNNAGLGDVGSLESADWPRLHAMLQVNMYALTLLTHSLLPGMIARRRGNILNLGSIAGYLPLPGFAVYAASKAYVNSFSEALHWELRGTGVTVTAVCPGPIQTEFLAVAARPNGRKAFNSPKMVEISSQEVVQLSIAGANQGTPRVVPGFLMWLGSLFLSKIPLSWLRLLFRLKAISVP